MNIWIHSIARAAGVEAPPGAEFVPVRPHEHPAVRRASLRLRLAAIAERIARRLYGECSPDGSSPLPQA